MTGETNSVDQKDKESLFRVLLLLMQALRRSVLGEWNPQVRVLTPDIMSKEYNDLVEYYVKLKNAVRKNLQTTPHERLAGVVAQMSDTYHKSKELQEQMTILQYVRRQYNYDEIIAAFDSSSNWVSTSIKFAIGSSSGSQVTCDRHLLHHTTCRFYAFLYLFSPVRIMTTNNDFVLLISFSYSMLFLY